LLPSDHHFAHLYSEQRTIAVGITQTPYICRQKLVIKQLILADKNIKWLLLAGLLIQIITSITAVGTSSADQHFQVIEFSLNQLGQPSGAPYVWEFDHFVRPTLQVYLFSGYHIALNTIGITDPYTQLTILRILLGLVMFTIFNLLAFHYFKNADRKILLFVLLLTNFSWSLPYTRTLFCSEMMSSLFFFGTLLIYDRNKNKTNSFLIMLMVGFLFSLAFYFRFQIAFCMVGFGIWMLFGEKKFNHILPIALGFAAGALINTYLDYAYYHEWVLTPYTYFHANINEGRAAGFGTSSFTRYIALLIGVMPAPLLSIFFFYYGIKTSFKKYLNPIFLSVIIFIVIHSLVGHKEERFMFPIFNALPLIAGWSIPSFANFYASAKSWTRAFVRFIIWLTVVLNTLLLLAITLVPYSQTIRFSEKLAHSFRNKPVQLFTLGQTPFETPARNPMVFYKNGAPEITLKRLSTLDSVLLFNNQIKYLATSFNEIKDKRKTIDSLGYKPVMYSNNLLWNVNEFLSHKKINTINEIWVLYKKD
jgi:phosphatidylinositol glycan class B